VLVGHHRADRLEHGLGDEVLGGDQLEVSGLAFSLEPDRLGDLWIGLLEPSHGHSAPVVGVRSPPTLLAAFGGVKARHHRTAIMAPCHAWFVLPRWARSRSDVVNRSRSTASRSRCSTPAAADIKPCPARARMRVGPWPTAPSSGTASSVP